MNCPKCGMMMSFDGNKYECELCGYTQGGIKMKIEITLAKRMKLSSDNIKPTVNRGVLITDCDEHDYGFMVDLIVGILKRNGIIANIKLKEE